MKKFRINEFLTLKLENRRTNIYVKGEQFRQCKYLAFHLDINNLKQYDRIESIDEMEQKDRSHQFRRLNIAPETEFWGHCSNLQAWVEHDYDTRILHRTMAFPLLKKLTEAGSNKAKNSFKEEITHRLSSGEPNIIMFLIEEGYLDYLETQELDIIVSNFEKLKKGTLKTFFMIFKDLRASGCKKAAQLFETKVKSCLTSKNRNEIKTLNLSHSDLSTFPESIGNLTSLKNLYLYKNKIKILPESIGHLTSLKGLYLYNNKITALPESIGHLTSLKGLYLSSNNLTSLPESIGNLTSLKELSLYNNNLTSLPESIGNLKSLEKLNLRSNEITALPESIEELKRRGVDFRK
jgi:Leucine-rich repeat (LRR) protein